MICTGSHSFWRIFALTIFFMIGSLVCHGICYGSDDCDAADESAACACLCHGPMALLQEPLVPVRHNQLDLVCREALFIPALLPADIFRPPLC